MDDDRRLITPPLSSPSLASLWFAPNKTHQYHPLVDTVLWSENKLWGNSTLGYHLLNILLHAGSALLIWRILRRLEVPGAWIAAAIFALHPVHVESVAWIAELKNTLSGFLFFSSILAYLKFDEKRSARAYVLVLVLFSLGLMAKAIVGVFPAAILILMWWKRGRLEWKRDLKPLIPFFILGIAAGLLTAWMEREFSGAKGPGFAFSMLDRCLIAGRAFWFYLGKLFWPANLIFIYPRWQVNSAAWWQYLFPVAALMVFVGAWALRSRWRWLLAALSFFVLVLLPMLGFFNVNFFSFSFVADHFQYLASLGPITAVAAGAGIMLMQAHGWQRIVYYGLCLGLLATLMTLTWRQSRMYRDAETCYGTIMKRNPDAWAAQTNFATGLLDQGRLDEALARFQTVLETVPNYSSGAKVAHLNMGNAFLRKGQTDDAIAHFREALKIFPDANVHNGLGSALHRNGQNREAIAEYERALKIDPQSTSTLSNFAWLLAAGSDGSLRNGPKAVELARRADAIAQGRSPVYLRSLAAAYAETGQFSEAVATAQRALDLAGRAGNRRLAALLTRELRLYQSGLPYREGPR